MKKQFHAKIFAYVSLSLCIFQACDARPQQELQDIIVNNIVVQLGLSNCQERYEAIKPILDKYKRPITVLDLGAGQGYFSFRIANDFAKYGATCVMNIAPSQQTARLLELCKLNTNLQNIALLNKQMSLSDLEKLADCEHFDVVLAFDYIDPNNFNWKKVTNAILRLGDNIFIQAPESNTAPKNIDSQNIAGYLAQKSGKLILQTPCVSDPKAQEQLFWFERNKRGLRCKCFGLESDDTYMDIFRIKSSYTEKTLLKNGKLTGPQWTRGINLVTFLLLNGTYPSKEQVKQEIVRLSHEKVTDFAPWNIIVQGNNLALIDQSDEKLHVNLQRSIDFINEFIDKSSTPGIYRLFKNIHKQKLTRNKWSWISNLL